MGSVDRSVEHGETFGKLFCMILWETLGFFVDFFD